MSLTVDLTSEEVAQIKNITCLQDDAAAVTKAAREYLRLSRLRELKAVSGKVDYRAGRLGGFTAPSGSLFRGDLG